MKVMKKTVVNLSPRKVLGEVELLLMIGLLALKMTSLYLTVFQAICRGLSEE